MKTIISFAVALLVGDAKATAIPMGKRAVDACKHQLELEPDSPLTDTCNQACDGLIVDIVNGGHIEPSDYKLLNFCSHMGIGPADLKILAKDYSARAKENPLAFNVKVAEHLEHKFEKKEDDIARLEKNADKTKEMNMKIKELKD